jgi:hypothetical protein
MIRIVFTQIVKWPLTPYAMQRILDSSKSIDRRSCGVDIRQIEDQSFGMKTVDGAIISFLPQDPA